MNLSGAHRAVDQNEPPTSKITTILNSIPTLLNTESLTSERKKMELLSKEKLMQEGFEKILPKTPENTPKKDIYQSSETLVNMSSRKCSEVIRQSIAKLKVDGELTELINSAVDGINKIELAVENISIEITVKGPERIRSPSPPPTPSGGFSTLLSFWNNLQDSGSGQNCDLPVVQNIEKFSVEQPRDRLEAPVLDVVEDVYKDEFFPKDHYNYIGLKAEECHCVASIMATPVLCFPDVHQVIDMGTCYRAMITDKNGTKLFVINSITLTSNESVEESIEQLLNSRARADYTFYHVCDPNFSKDMASVEEKHCQKILRLKVAVLYAKPNQTNLTEIFNNKPPANSPFYSWLDTVGKKINLKGWECYRGDFGEVDADTVTYYTVWNGIEIIFHIAPWMGAEQHRRLIGNDICFIIFYEDPNFGSFNPVSVDALGTVPQVFTVVQPNKKMYRLGFFHRHNLKPYNPPCPPSRYLFDAASLKDYMFSKLHNGMVMSRRSPPMNRLFSEPRANTIKELGLKYPKPTAKELRDNKKQKAMNMNNKRKSLNTLAGKKIVSKPSLPSLSDSLALIDGNLKEVLVVQIIGGRNLTPVEKNVSHPYCSVKLADQEQVTPVIKKSLHPSWNTEFTFSLDGVNKDNQNLHISCYNSRNKIAVTKNVKKTDYLGEIKIPVKTAVSQNGTSSQWYPLLSSDSTKVTGDIEIKISYYKTDK